MKSTFSPEICKRIKKLIEANQQGTFDDSVSSILPYILEMFYIEKYGRKLGSYPDEVFHYTSYEAAMNIIVANVQGTTLTKDSHNGRPSIWLKSILYMNDRNELKPGRSIMNKHLSQRILPDSLTNAVKQEALNSSLTSFTGKRDSIPLWGMYGARGHGIMLGIRSATLQNIAPSAGLFGRVTYNKMEFEDIIDSVFQYYELVSDVGKIRLAEHFGKYWFAPLHAFCKHFDFNYEEEYRLVVQSAPNQLSYAHGPFTFLPYDVTNHQKIGNHALDLAGNSRYFPQLKCEELREKSLAIKEESWLKSLTFGPNVSSSQRQALEIALKHSTLSPDLKRSKSSLTC